MSNYQTPPNPYGQNPGPYGAAPAPGPTAPAPGYGDPQQQYPPQQYAQQQQYPPQYAMQPGPPEHMLADLGPRLGAKLLDVVFIIVIAAILIIPTSATGDDGVAAIGAVLTWIGAYLLYEPLTAWKLGGSLGKRICGLRVARLDNGQPLGFGAALGRWLLYLLMGIVPFLGLINALSCTWDKPFRRTFHDKALGTVVLKRNVS